MTEMAIRNDIKDTRLSLIDIVDNDTRFLLASKKYPITGTSMISKKCLIETARE